MVDETRRSFIKTVGAGAGAIMASGLWGCGSPGKRGRLPNVIMIFTDDQGYQDVGVYGAKGFETPHLDRMADEGVHFTDFYVGAPICTPSRAALMTGCYPQRIGLPYVLGPDSEIGLHPDEVTIAEMLTPLGYATACYGKWHLGDHPEFLPMSHGFDDYFGLPYSNDMWPKHPTHPQNYPPLPLIEGEKVIETNPDQTQLTTQYTQRAVRFIQDNKDQPFFLYLAHSMPHVPLFVSDKFKGKSEQGLYGDVIMEIDWSVGQIMNTLRDLSLDEDTLVIFTADNGPWLRYGDHAGSAKPLREGKHTVFDGGQREPCIMWWPGHIAGGQVCREITTAMDILPTIAHLTGAPLPTHPIDGRNIWPLMRGDDNAKSPHEAFYYYHVWELKAVRSGQWKLHFPHEWRDIVSPGSGGMPGDITNRHIELSLFNLETDVGEERNVAADHPDVVERLSALGEKMRAELGDKDLKGAGRRKPGRL